MEISGPAPTGAAAPNKIVGRVAVAVSRIRRPERSLTRSIDQTARIALSLARAPLVVTPRRAGDLRGRGSIGHETLRRRVPFRQARGTQQRRRVEPRRERALINDETGRLEEAGKRHGRVTGAARTIAAVSSCHSVTYCRPCAHGTTRDVPVFVVAAPQRRRRRFCSKYVAVLLQGRRSTDNSHRTLPCKVK